MKKLVALISISIFVLSISFNALAENTVGTYDEGIVSGNYAIYKFDPTNGFQNGDFSKGFMYWGTVMEGGPKNEARLVTENGNTYVQLVPIANYSGIMSIKFICNDYKPGDRAVVIYDWKGSENNQVFLCQVGQEDVRIGNGPDEKIIEASSSGWNTSITKVTGTVFEPTNGNLNLTFYMGLQSTTDRTADTCFDNVRLGVLLDDGTVKDLAGNIVGKSTQLEKEKKDESKATAQKAPSKEEKTDIEEKSTISLSKDEILVIVLASAVVLFIGIDVFIFVLFRKRKKHQEKLHNDCADTLEN